MDQLFIIKLLISFLLGGFWVIFATIAADRFGSKVGGMIGGMPSTVLFALLFIALTQDANVAAQSTTIVPIVEGVDYLFILTYLLLVKKGFWLSLTSAFVVFFIFSFPLAFLKFDSYPLSLFVYLVMIVLSYLIIERVLKIKSVAGRKIKYTLPVIVFRGFLSGSIIAFAVFMGKIAGPIWGGLFTAFPAIFSSTIIITYFSQGVDFSKATIKATLFSSTSVVVYSMIVRYSYVPYGILKGTIAAIIISYFFSYLIYKFVVKKIK